MTNNKCPICGEPTRVIMGIPHKNFLCAEHAFLLKFGRVTRCEKCLGFYDRAKGCSKCLEKENKRKRNEKWKQGQCLVCHEETKTEFLFCKKCYFKYRDKSLLLKVNECSLFEKLDDFYEGRYVCADGHIVKSKSEREIDNYLFNNDIKHAYEREILLEDRDGKEYPIDPDFCLYIDDEEVFLEHWSFDESNEEYTNRKNFKISLYKQNGITLICTHEKYDAEDIETALTRKLRKFQYGKINFLKK